MIQLLFVFLFFTLFCLIIAVIQYKSFILTKYRKHAKWSVIFFLLAFLSAILVSISFINIKYQSSNIKGNFCSMEWRNIKIDAGNDSIKLSTDVDERFALHTNLSSSVYVFPRYSFGKGNSVVITREDWSSQYSDDSSRGYEFILEYYDDRFDYTAEKSRGKSIVEIFHVFNDNTCFHEPYSGDLGWSRNP
ncbi:hypothetical protein A2533_04650 [Candidatus Falkowbacteria bacterium RIFOXYD2_FULL_35_9]|uniref:Uncharacterized protein n=1 Tax=Candidatus Falkowbacteria bacterium RIFOXYC2_FULL_36_12 TaxID=1798002 RepID=A0A1F5T389_9BACT|nr:MAG: hypothetical protein A2478_01625 [Candidatus Falkowbacteria bacterium RIFOXYC2_FULL_36_12]OGF33957.1 MAG: hypothetical protein A2223_03345 [Candidatus Falkowbacteria bacterium RIFOXYA2_FULL_35_8]OGF46063.1 MAG: hypothetical protein A2533_04650 [Candidatus Falkowbacteria bacterium RIFOXYD2_FULL_35_9]